MATRTWSIHNDHSVSISASDIGNAKDQHMPLGKNGVYTFRGLLSFITDLSSMASISSATLHMRSTAQTHIAFGSSPTVRVWRNVAAWEPGSGGSEGVWSSSANPKGSTAPARTSTGQSPATNMTRTNNTWDTVDVTAIAQAWLAGSPNYGVTIKAESDTSVADAWEFYTRDYSSGSSAPYITVTYTPTSTNLPPSNTPVSPQTGDIVNATFDAASGSVYPNISWTYSDPEGTAQSAFQIVIYADNAGSPGAAIYATPKVQSAALSYVTPFAMTNGAYYWWQVTSWDGTDTFSGSFVPVRFRAVFGSSTHYLDMGGVPIDWSIANLTSTGSVTIQYNSADDASGTNFGAWQSDITSVTKRRFFYYRVWLLGGGNPGSLNSIQLNYSFSTPALDSWTLPAGGQADISTLVYGSQSLRIDGAGVSTDRRAYQIVSVLPNTHYWLSGRIRQTGAAGASILLSNTPTDGGLVGAPATQEDWKEYTVEWDSGANTSVYVQCAVVGGAGTYGWFDALKLEAATKASAWTPSFVGRAAAVDAQGVQVDASRGGTMRVRTNNGTTVTLTDAGTTVAGAKGGNAALGSLITQLANLGVIKDTTSA